MSSLLIPAGTIGADYYRYEEGIHALRGERAGETYRLGDKVQVKLVEAAPVAGALRFELVSEGRYSGKPRGGPKRKRGPDAARGASARTRVKTKKGRRAGGR